MSTIQPVNADSSKHTSLAHDSDSSSKHTSFEHEVCLDELLLLK